MQDFKYTLRNTAIFLAVILIALSIFPVYYVFFATDFEYYENDQRNAMAGTIDTIASGASHIMYCFNPDIYDEYMGTISYNLGGSLIPMKGRYALLEAEIARNPVKTLILEMSYNALSRGSEDDVEGNMFLIPRFPTTQQKLRYFMEHTPYADYDATYSFAFLHGLQYMVFRTESINNRGMVPGEPENLQVTQEEYPLIYDTMNLSTNIQEENMFYLEKIFQLCEENNIRVIMVTVPVAERFILRSTGIQQTYEQLCDVAANYACLFMDFNLHKEKLDMFPDTYAYTNETHMTTVSGSEFTELLAKTIQAYDDGEDIFSDFYSSYEQIPVDLP